jgi:hypothetical protein
MQKRDANNRDSVYPFVTDTFVGFCFAFAVLGSVTVRMPFFISAVTLLLATVSGTRKCV